MMIVKLQHHRILRLPVLLVLLGTLISSCVVSASEKIEVISLQQRPAEELIPVIKPVLRSGETVTGKGYQLVLSAAPERITELKGMVAQLDGAVQQVRIAVRRASPREIDAEALQAKTAVSVSGGDVDARARARIYSTRTRSQDNDQFSVTTLEGTPAYIQTGESIPVPGGYGYYGGPVAPARIVSPGMWYKDVTSGFYAVARVHNDSVTLHVSPQREALSNQGNGTINTSGLVTTVRGRLGEWLELGGTSDSSTQRSRGITHSTRSREDDKTTWWVKVDSVE